MDENIIIEMLKKHEQTLQQIKKEITNSQTPEVNLSQVSKLSEQLKLSISKVDEVIEATKKPVIRERKFTIDILSKGTIGLMIGMFIAIVLLAIVTNHALTPNYSQSDNDLKYRYIKMKGEANSDLIIELEDVFEVNRDKNKITTIKKFVESYEETIRKKVIADEQTRLKLLEKEKLDNEINLLKNK